MEKLHSLNVDIDRDLSSHVKSYYVFNNCIDSKYNSRKTNNNTLLVTIDDKVFGSGENINGVCGQGHNNNTNKLLIINELSEKMC